MLLRWILLHSIKFGVQFRKQSIDEFKQHYPSKESVLSYHHDVLDARNITQMLTSMLTYIFHIFQLFTDPTIDRFGAYGSLLGFLGWWAIELLPVGYKVENKFGIWRKVYVPNLGRRRIIPKKARLHWSVFYRLHYVKDYTPTNLDKEINGQKFAELFQDFQHMFSKQDLEAVIRDLTLQKVRQEWSSPIWNRIPDDLQDLSISNNYS